MHDEASARIYDMLAEPGGEPPRGTIAIALYSPATAAALGRMYTYLWTESALEPRLLELLSLIAAREMDLAYEWSAHYRTALEAGLEPAVIEGVRMSEPITGLSNFDALIIDFGRQLFRSRHVDSGTFAALVQRHGRQEAFDIIMALTYHMMAGVLQRAVDQRPPEAGIPRLCRRWQASAHLPADREISSRSGRVRHSLPTFMKTPTTDSRCSGARSWIRGAGRSSIGSLGRR